jgi:mannose-6-phosphate isomerase-like protein (cupin superfamily)
VPVPLESLSAGWLTAFRRYRLAPVRLRRLSEAQVEERGRLRSHILLDAGDLGCHSLSVTWVDVPPGAEQRLHSHDESEQVYVVVRGRGRMNVAGDIEEVEEGDLIFIPPGADHGIANDGSEDLVYVTTASPPVSMEELYQVQLAPDVPDFEDDL